MLVYHPMYDVRHCYLRVITILLASEGDSIEIDRMRILDFYLCNPSMLSEFKFPRNMTKIKKKYQEKKNIYNQVPNKKQAFIKLSRIQDSIFERMASQDIINRETYAHGIIQLNQGNADKFSNIKSNTNSICEQTLSVLTISFTSIDLLGKNGLKSRSELLDYRYDAT